MNSFFASVEQHLRPELRGRPVAVVPVESDNTSVIAASYEAKRLGIKMGTRVGDARALCPALQVVQARPDEYVRVHEAIAQSIDTCAPVHKVYSIDEWAIQLAPEERTPKAAKELALRIKSRIRTDFSSAITCSIGIAPTRLLAKIASDLRKPDGLTVLQVSDLPHRLEEMSLQDLCGIGRGMAQRLAQNNIRTIAELWQLDRRQSILVWGSVSGAHWWAGFHGQDEPEIPTRRGSMTHANVLEPRFRNSAGARAMLMRLICRLGSRLRADNYLAASLSVYIEQGGGSEFSTGVDLPLVNDTPSLLEAFYTLWSRRLPARTATPIHVGVTVSGLVHASQVAGNLFRQADKSIRLSRAMDRINQTWGLTSLYVGSMHGCLHHMDDKIAFGRIPPRIKLVPRTRRGVV
ncbi:MAG TPA: hypothetical protein VG711_11085 [Phycisphaerales bacterium]|nr:hypothetical protein [Phycisphaerales bacterium]